MQASGRCPLISQSWRQDDHSTQHPAYLQLRAASSRGRAGPHKGALIAFDHNVFVYSGVGDLPARLELDRFDVIVCHYSIFVANDRFLSPMSRYRIRAYRGLKAMFIHDEYRHVNATVEAIAYLGVDLLFTCVAESEWEKIYPVSCLPGLFVSTS